ncbi:sialoadhesin-like isoform 2-T2 [Pholidichthys leucotaenia]
MSLMRILPVNTMNIISLLLSLFFISGTLDACSKDARLFITTPINMEALSGSCLIIPCNFRTTEPVQFDSSRHVNGVWIKNNPYFHNKRHNVIFNSSMKNNIYPMTITGDLRQKNCNTLFSNLTINYTDVYYFRIENAPDMATALCNPPKITIKDSPRSPSITISDSHQETEENTNGTFTTKIQETITLSDTHDGNKIICSVRYPVYEGKDFKKAKTENTLSVSYAPKETSASISPPGWVSAGSWVNLSCSSRAKPPVSLFTWFKRSTDGDIEVSEGDVYSFNVTQGGVYYCVATNHLGNQTSADIHVQTEVPKNAFLLGIVLGVIGIILLICLIICAWWLTTRHQTQSQISEELVAEKPGDLRAGKEENIHYGEINFAMHRQEPSSDSVQDRGQQESTVYAQVKVNNSESSSTQTAQGPEELYAQVQKT